MSTTAEPETTSAAPAPGPRAAMWSEEQFRADAERGGALRAAYHRVFDHFVVSTSSGASLAYLDGLRGVAVLLVVVFHVWILSGTPGIAVTVPLIGRTENLTIFFAAGFVGVNLFFVLSGFLLSQYWLRADYAGRPRPSTRRYLRHRLFRIVPAYYFVLLVTLVLLTPALIPPALVYSNTGLFILGAHLTFTQYLFPISSSSYGVNGPMWTLTMEMTFYLLLPWAVRLFVRNRWLIALPVSVAISLGWLWLARHSLGPLVQFWQQQNGLDEATVRYFLSQQFPAHAANFAVGITLANLHCRLQRGDYDLPRVARILAGPRGGTLSFLLGVALVLAGMERFRNPEALWYRYYGWELTVSIGFALTLAGLLRGASLLRTLFSLMPLRFVGIVGYSAYLWHMPLIYLFNKFPQIAALPPEARFRRVALAVAVALPAISAVTYLAVEKPFLLIGRRHAGATAAPSTRALEPAAHTARAAD